MPNDCIDFEGILRMRFTRKPGVLIKPRPFVDFPIGSTIVLSSSDECRGICKYTRIDIDGVPGVLDEDNKKVYLEDPTNPWWFAESDVNPDRTVKVAPAIIRYGELPIGGVFKYQGFVCIKRWKGLDHPFVPLTNEDVFGIPNVFNSDLVEYIGDVTFTEV